MSEQKATYSHQDGSDSIRNASSSGDVVATAYRAPTVNAGVTSIQEARCRGANPGPLGLAGFAFTTFLLSLVNLQARDVKVPNIVLAPALAYGGITQFCAGMWEMAAGNTFGATALGSYGAFWVSYGFILMPSLGVAEAYPSAAELNHAIGFFLIGFFVFTVLLILCTMKTSVLFCLLLTLVDITFLLLGIANLLTDDVGEANQNLAKAGGVFGILAAFVAWYIVYADMADNQNSFVLAPQPRMPWGAHERRSKDLQNEQGTDGYSVGVVRRGLDMMIRKDVEECPTGA